MLRIALVYGLISGGIVIAITAIGISLADASEMSGNQAIGYLIMLIALSSIFFAVRSYRDKYRGGIIRFWPAFGLGTLIAAIAGLAYTLGWEIFLAATDYGFMADYMAATLEARREAGASEAEIAETAAQMERMSEMYSNPLFRLPITFLEIFPVGVLVALVCAVILRRPTARPAAA